MVATWSRFIIFVLHSLSLSLSHTQARASEANLNPRHAGRLVIQKRWRVGGEFEYKHLHSMLTIFNANTRARASARKYVSATLYLCEMCCTHSRRFFSSGRRRHCAPCPFGRKNGFWTGLQWVSGSRSGGGGVARNRKGHQLCAKRALYMYLPRVPSHPPPCRLYGAGVNGQRYRSRHCRRRN